MEEVGQRLYTETYLHRRALLIGGKKREKGKALSLETHHRISEGGRIFEQTTAKKKNINNNKADSKSLDGKAARFFNGLRQLLMHLFVGRVGWQVQPIKACVRLGQVFARSVDQVNSKEARTGRPSGTCT